MLIGFVGIPASGKSTVACNMFCNFKKNLTNSELIVEEARKFISEYRFDNKLSPNSSISLTDSDQLQIASRQFKTEKVFKYSCGINTVIISDSSVFNSLLYMSDEAFNGSEIEEFYFNKMRNHYDILFYCSPIDMEYLPYDSNRIHNKEQMVKIEERAKKLLNRLKDNGIRVEILLGDQLTRTEDACSIVLNSYCKVLETTQRDEFQSFIGNDQSKQTMANP